MPGSGIPPCHGALALQLIKLSIMVYFKNLIYCFPDTRTSGLKPSKCACCCHPGINSGVSEVEVMKFTVNDNLTKRSQALTRSLILQKVFVKKDISYSDAVTKSLLMIKELAYRNLTNPGIYAGVGHTT